MNGLLSCMTRVVFGCEPSQISLFFFLYVCSSANGVKKLLETTEGSAQEFRVKVSLNGHWTALGLRTGVLTLIFQSYVSLSRLS